MPTSREQPKAPPPLVVHLVRHAEACNDDGIDAHGPQLTGRGRRQAHYVAKRLAKERYAGIYSSDLTRARQTADAIALHHDDDLVTVTRDLREVSGYHSALRLSRLTVHHDRSLVDEQEAMNRMVGHFRHMHCGGQKILVVSHGNLTRSLIPLLGGLDPAKAPLIEIHNASLSIVHVWSTGHAVVLLANGTSHIPERLIT